jgi:hypothetical protein
MSNDIRRSQDDPRPMGQPKSDTDRERSGRPGSPDAERQRTGKSDQDSDRLDQNRPGQNQPGQDQGQGQRSSNPDRNETDNE